MTQTGALYEWLVTSVHRNHGGCSEAVVQWLEDVRLTTETECMCVLQGKSLTHDDAELVLNSTKPIKDSIKSIQSRAQVIASEFSKLTRRVDKERWKHVRSGTWRITCHIRSLLHECSSAIGTSPVEYVQHEQSVLEECARLAQYVDSHEQNGYSPERHLLEELLSRLGTAFNVMVDLSISLLLQKLIRILAESADPYLVKPILNDLVCLGLEGEHMCYLIARENAVDVLFNICSLPGLEATHGQALRAVATICCIPESISELENIGGVERLSDILSNMSGREAVRSEAAGVVAQITSPSLTHCRPLPGLLENMEDLIRSLTELCVEASCHEVFLLGSAALANITFMDSLACDFLLQYHTAQVLIEASHFNKAHSYFAKDQVATVLANMAALENCSQEILENNGLELLINLLHERPLLASSDMELAACERLQHKAAVAVMRICRDADTVQMLIELQGVARLVQLCKEPKERSHSSLVLVACLKALRELLKFSKVVENLDDATLQLIDPPSTSSFLFSSEMDESVV